MSEPDPGTSATAARPRRRTVRFLPAATLTALVGYAVLVPWWAGTQTADFAQALLPPRPGTVVRHRPLRLRPVRSLR